MKRINVLWRATRIGVFALALAVAMGISTGVASAAPADASQCGSYAVCLYTDQGYGGQFVGYAQGQWVFDNDLRNDGINDDVSSIISNWNGNLCFFSDIDQSGLEFQIGPDQSWATLPSWIDNQISSFTSC